MPGSMSVAAFARDCSLQVDQVLLSRYVCHLNGGLVEILQLTTLAAVAASQEQAQCGIPSCASCSQILQNRGWTYMGGSGPGFYHHKILGA